MDEREYLERWIKRLVDFRTQEYPDVIKASVKLDEILTEHLREVCEKVNILDVDAQLDDNFMPMLTYYIQCDDKLLEIYVGATRKISLEIGDSYIYY
jgi:hypothetical protein